MDHCHKNKPWFKERVFVILFVVLVVLLVAFFVPFFNPILAAFLDYFYLIWWAILLGLLLGGLIDYLVPRTYVSKLLAKREKKTIFSAVVLGFLMSACSHGILAIAMELYKKGASVPAVIAFLLASPWANITITIMLFGFFGVKALFLIVAAILIAIITGLIYQVLERKKWIEPSLSVKVSKNFSIKKDIRLRWNNYAFAFSRDVGGVIKGTWRLAKMVFGWILIGMLLASIARAFVPVDFFHQYMGATILGLFITLIIATIIEVCSEGTSPMAFEIYNQTGAFGNSFVFLIAGVATDMTEIGLIWTNIGKRAALWLPVVAGPQIVIVGYLFNILL